MAEPLVECVPNFSEGSDSKIVSEIVHAMEVPGVYLLDWSMDAAHNRSVVTVAGPPEAVAESAIRGVGRAAELIDLTKQAGVHPRVGAADVVPFVPVRDYTLVQCAHLAHKVGHQIWHRYGVPVYFYEAAATRPDRVRLEEVRRGQFEGLWEAIRTDPARCPDIGDCSLHRTAGASMVGARGFLIAYNIYLESADLAVARAIARALRASSGGLPGVKALGVMVGGRAQVSMNVTDFQVTSVSRVYEAALRLAEARGVALAEGELIGLIPQSACEVQDGRGTLPEWARQIPGFSVEKRVLECRLQKPMPWPGGAIASATQGSSEAGN